MNEDEAGTLAPLKPHRKDFIDPTIAEHRGLITPERLIGMLREGEVRSKQGETFDAIRRSLQTPEESFAGDTGTMAR